MNNLYPGTTTNPIRRWFSLAIWVVVAICICLVLLRFVGYGTLKVSVPDKSVVMVNGHTLTDPSQRLRAGTYTITVVSPRYKSYQGEITVHNFFTTNFKPKLEERKPSNILGSIIGSYGYFGPPVMYSARWFDDNTWLAGSVGPGSSTYIALQYTNGTWSVAYFDGIENYPTDLSRLPSDVAGYIRKLQEVDKNAT